MHGGKPQDNSNARGKPSTGIGRAVLRSIRKCAPLVRVDVRQRVSSRMLDDMDGTSGPRHEHGHAHGHNDEHAHDHGNGHAHGHADEHGRKHAPDHEPGHDHEPGRGHGHGAGVTGRLLHAVRPHSHEAADKVDAAMEASSEGMRALWISLGVLGATAVIQAAVVALSGSVALLGDTLHNAADALTAVPLGVAFLVGRRPPDRRYTYGYGRAEDLAGVAIVVLIAASCALAASVAVSRLLHPHRVSDLAAVAAAALAGF